MPQITEGYVNADDARLYFRSAGSGPVVVVVHGGPGMDHRLLLPQFDSLLPGFQVVLYDQRFCGRSTGCDDLSRLTMPQMVEDLEALRIGLGLSVIRTVGFSFGGLIAMQHAALHRQEVSHLVLLNSLPARAIELAQFEAILAKRRSAENVNAIATLSTSTGFVDGEADSLSEYFRHWFRPYFLDEVKLEQLTLEFVNTPGRQGQRSLNRFAS